MKHTSKIKPDILAVVAVTIYLLVYLVLLRFESTMRFAFFMGGLSPVPVIWMVFTVLRRGEYKGRELEADEEFGYQDKKKSELGTF